MFFFQLLNNCALCFSSPSSLRPSHGGQNSDWTKGWSWVGHMGGVTEGEACGGGGHLGTFSHQLHCKWLHVHVQVHCSVPVCCVKAQLFCSSIYTPLAYRASLIPNSLIEGHIREDNVCLSCVHVHTTFYPSQYILCPIYIPIFCGLIKLAEIWTFCFSPLLSCCYCLTSPRWRRWVCSCSIWWLPSLTCLPSPRTLDVCVPQDTVWMVSGIGQ